MLGSPKDEARSLTGCDYGLDMVTDESRTWTECGHGLTAEVDADWTWIIHGHGLDADTSVAVLWNFPDAAWKLPGCCAESAWTVPGNCRNVTRQLHGCFTSYRVAAAPETTRMVRGRCAVVAWQFAR